MSRHTILSAIGADRPGLVDEVSEFVLARGGSIEDSRMVNLHGQFAIMMSIGGPPETIDRLEGDLDALRSQSGIHAELTPAEPTLARAAATIPFRLTGRALDQAGLVHSVAHLLRSLDVNIESVATTLESAPITGAPIFAMELIVAVRADTSVAKLREELAGVCDLLNIDWHLAAL